MLTILHSVFEGTLSLSVPYWICHCLCQWHWWGVTCKFHFSLEGPAALSCMVPSNLYSHSNGGCGPFHQRYLVCCEQKGCFFWALKFRNAVFFLHCLVKPGLTLTSCEVFIKEVPPWCLIRADVFFAPWAQTSSALPPLPHCTSLYLWNWKPSIFARLYCNLKKMQIHLSSC